MDAGEGHRARGTGDRPEERDREKGKGAIAKGCEAIGRFGTVSAKAGKTSTAAHFARPPASGRIHGASEVGAHGRLGVADSALAPALANVDVVGVSAGPVAVLRGPAVSLPRTYTRQNQRLNGRQDKRGGADQGEAAQRAKRDCNAKTGGQQGQSDQSQGVAPPVDKFDHSSQRRAEATGWIA
jgi:hypothetical protein